MLEKGGRQTFRNIRSVCVPTSPTKKMQSWKLTTRTSLSCDVFFCDMFSTSWTWFSIIERDLTISWLHLRCADELDACASEIRRSGGLKASTIGMDTVEFFSWEGTSGFFPIRQKNATCYFLRWAAVPGLGAYSCTWRQLTCLIPDTVSLVIRVRTEPGDPWKPSLKVGPSQSLGKLAQLFF